MSKLDSYDWKGLPPDLIEFLEDLTEFWNTGRIPLQYSASPPTSSTSADGPGILISKDGATWNIYIYTNATDKWYKVALTAV